MWLSSAETAMERLYAQCLHRIFEMKVMCPRSKTVQGQPRSRAWGQSIAHGWFPIWHPLLPSSYVSPFSKCLISNFSDIELRQFKVIHITAHVQFPIWPLLSLTTHLSPFLPCEADMLARSWDRNSVCASVRLSVHPSVTRVLCDETKEHSA